MERHLLVLRIRASMVIRKGKSCYARHDMQHPRLLVFCNASDSTTRLQGGFQRLLGGVLSLYDCVRFHAVNGVLGLCLRRHQRPASISYISAISTTTF